MQAEEIGNYKLAERAADMYTSLFEGLSPAANVDEMQRWLDVEDARLGVIAAAEDAKRRAARAIRDAKRAKFAAKLAAEEAAAAAAAQGDGDEDEEAAVGSAAAAAAAGAKQGKKGARGKKKKGVVKRKAGGKAAKEEEEDGDGDADAVDGGDGNDEGGDGAALTSAPQPNPQVLDSVVEDGEVDDGDDGAGGGDGDGDGNGDGGGDSDGLGVEEGARGDGSAEADENVDGDTGSGIVAASGSAVEGTGSTGSQLPPRDRAVEGAGSADASGAVPLQQAPQDGAVPESSALQGAAAPSPGGDAVEPAYVPPPPRPRLRRPSEEQRSKGLLSAIGVQKLLPKYKEATMALVSAWRSFPPQWIRRGDYFRRHESYVLAVSANT
jgi:hypothetical protein